MKGTGTTSATTKRIRQLWDAVSNEFERKIGDEGDIFRQHQVNPMIFDLLRKCDGKNVIDVGCGNGYLLPMLRNKGYCADGLDISQEQLEYASKRMFEGELYEADIENMNSLPSREYDILICSFVLDGLGDLRSALSGCLQLLRKHGHLIINIPHPCFIGYEFWNEGQTVDYVREDSKGQEVYLYRCTKPVMYFQRPLSSYLNALANVGFYVKKICEPDPKNIDQYFIDSNRKPKPAYCLGVLAMRVT